MGAYPTFLEGRIVEFGFRFSLKAVQPLESGLNAVHVNLAWSLQLSQERTMIRFPFAVESTC